jgi:TolB-like protein/Flp pilus assembly protein TadD
MTEVAGKELYRVAGLLIDVEAHLVSRDGEVVPLPPKTLELLVTLVRRAPGVVTRRELLDTVWPNEIVNDEALTQRLMLLRRALADDPKNPTYIASEPVAAPATPLSPVPAPPPDAPPRSVARHTYSHRPLFWLLAPLVIAALAVAIYLLRGRAASSDSIAILPFVIGAGDPATEMISDGIRETLTNTLARLPGLRVIAASSMSRYKAAPADPQEVSRELGVRTVVSGRIVQQGETLSLNAELVSAADGTQLWGGTFIRPLSDIFVVEEDLAAEIVQRLRPRLSPADRDLLRTHYTADIVAYQLYLKGRYHWNKRTVQGFNDAIACFKQAIASDPAYALAYAGLADCYALLGAAEYGALPPREAFPKARAAAARALEIDPGLAEAHASLGLVQWTFDWDRAAAERSLRRAIQLAPGYASSHQWYAEMLAETGRQREADGEIRRALDLDPLSLVINADLGLFAYYARDYDQAAEYYKATLAMEPHFVPARLGLALAYAQQTQFAEALAEVAEAGKVAPGEPGVLVADGYVLGRAGRSAEARAVTADLQRLSTQRFVPAYYVGGVLVGLGDTGGAFTWLAKACEQRCSLLGALEVDPAFDPLRDDPRFAELLRCAGLAP